MIEIELVGGAKDGEIIQAHPSMNALFHVDTPTARAWYEYVGLGKAHFVKSEAWNPWRKEYSEKP